MLLLSPHQLTFTVPQYDPDRYEGPASLPLQNTSNPAPANVRQANIWVVAGKHCAGQSKTQQWEYCCIPPNHTLYGRRSGCKHLPGFTNLNNPCDSCSTQCMLCKQCPHHPASFTQGQPCTRQHYATVCTQPQNTPDCIL
jgi:hypothetical protein